MELKYLKCIDGRKMKAMVKAVRRMRKRSFRIDGHKTEVVIKDSHTDGRKTKARQRQLEGSADKAFALMEGCVDKAHTNGCKTKARQRQLKGCTDKALSLMAARRGP
nr:hypothetical protein CFP56_19100 [Quercus suber]